MSTDTFPNGSSLTSSALTQTDIENAFQTLTTAILGEGTDPNSAVRISWPTAGAPGWAITDDVVFLRATISDDQINRIRNKSYTTLDEATLSESVQYTRVWSIGFTLYGPNSLDHARLIKSALFMDWSHDILAALNLYAVLDISDPRRVPELFAGQWWERVDFACRFNEGVTEQTSVASIASVEVILQDATHTVIIDATT